MKQVGKLYSLRFVGFVVFCLFTATNPLHAEWTQTNGPGGGKVQCFATNGTNLFAGTWGGGVFLSTNNGTNWTQVNTGLTNTYVNALAFSPNGTGGTNLFAGTQGGGVFRSTNNGTNWTEVNTGLGGYVSAFAPTGQAVRISLPGFRAASFFPPTTVQAGMRATRGWGTLMSWLLPSPPTGQAA